MNFYDLQKVYWYSLRFYFSFFIRYDLKKLKLLIVSSFKLVHSLVINKPAALKLLSASIEDR